MEFKICDWMTLKSTMLLCEHGCYLELVNPDAKEKKEFEVKIERKSAMESMLRFQVTILVAMKWLCKANRISECGIFSSQIKLNDKKPRVE